MEEIQKMQDNLLLIRRTVGWTAKEFGDRIGVTRQTINNIESGRNKLTKTQYIAMRAVLDAEIAENPEETEMLKILLDMLVDHPDKYSKEDQKMLLKKANIMSPSILTGSATRKSVSKEWMIAVATTSVLGIIASTLSLTATPNPDVNSWLIKAINSGKK